jgi:hypothetical protein
MIFRLHRAARSRVLKLLIVSLVLAGISSATSITMPATVTITSPGGLTGTEQWASGASLTSKVTYDNGLYNYEYTWSEPDKDISHIIIELCFGTGLDVIDTSLIGDGIDAITFDTYTSSSHGGSNPGLAGSIFGFKIDFGDGVKTTTFNFTTHFAPMLGDVYAKDGRAGGPGGGGYVYANGSGIYVPSCDTCPPDMGEVPEPSTMALMGVGLLGAGILRLRRK